MVEATKIARILGLGAVPDVGALCRHHAVNRWSRYKPLAEYGAAATLGDLAYRGADGLCGLHAVRATYLADLLDQPGAWEYDRPRGGSQWYRLSDFDGYLHDALPPLEAFNVPSYVSAQNGATFSVALVETAKPRVDISGTPDYSAAGSLTLDEISIDGRPLSEFYFGVAFFKASGAFLWATSATSPGTLLLRNISFPEVTSAAPGDTLTAVPFLSRDRVATTRVDIPGLYFLPPGVTPQQVAYGSESQAAGVQLSVTATMVRAITLDGSDGPIASVEVNARIDANATERFTSCSVTLWRGTPGAAASHLLGTVWQGTILTSALTPWTRTWRVRAADLNETLEAAPDYWVLFSLGSIRRSALVAYPRSHTPETIQ